MSDETVHIQKIAAHTTVSIELLNAVSDAWMIAMGLKPDPRTPEQIEADRAASEARDDAERAECEAAHAAVLATADGVRRAVLDLHAPVWGYWQASCNGCDMDGYEAEAPMFPCRTYELARDFQH